MVEARPELLGVLPAEGDDFVLVMVQLLLQHHDLLIGGASPRRRLSS
jgi:hypothetical protein